MGALAFWMMALICFCLGIGLFVPGLILFIKYSKEYPRFCKRLG